MKRPKHTTRFGLPLMFVAVAALGAFLVALGAAAWPSPAYTPRAPHDASARARQIVDAPAAVQSGPEVGCDIEALTAAHIAASLPPENAAVSALVAQQALRGGRTGAVAPASTPHPLKRIPRK